MSLFRLSTTARTTRSIANTFSYIPKPRLFHMSSSASTQKYALERAVAISAVERACSLTDKVFRNLVTADTVTRRTSHLSLWVTTRLRLSSTPFSGRISPRTPSSAKRIQKTCKSPSPSRCASRSLPLPTRPSRTPRRNAPLWLKPSPNPTPRLGVTAT